MTLPFSQGFAKFRNEDEDSIFCNIENESTCLFCEYFFVTLDRERKVLQINNWFVDSIREKSTFFWTTNIGLMTGEIFSMYLLCRENTTFTNVNGLPNHYVVWKMMKLRQHFFHLKYYCLMHRMKECTYVYKMYYWFVLYLFLTCIFLAVFCNVSCNNSNLLIKRENSG